MRWAPAAAIGSGEPSIPLRVGPAVFIHITLGAHCRVRTLHSTDTDACNLPDGDRHAAENARLRTKGSDALRVRCHSGTGGLWASRLRACLTLRSSAAVRLARPARNVMKVARVVRRDRLANRYAESTSRRQE